ncbi:hypothetical protein JW948_11920 [bacterium]|nr:hypothetical protein [bacterium]
MLMKRWTTITGCMMLGWILTGCVNPFAPELTQSIESADLIVTQQLSPDEVLQNFKVSYIFRDSLLYSNLLDTAFVFYYYDPGAVTSGTYVSWNRETDLRITGRLFRHFQVIDLVWHSTIYEDIGENEGKIGKQYDLTVVSENQDYHATGKALFTFKKCWDSTWRITQWKDDSEL